jgi:hypothetical protein
MGFAFIIPHILVIYSFFAKCITKKSSTIFSRVIYYFIQFGTEIIHLPIHMIVIKEVKLAIDTSIGEAVVFVVVDIII